MNLSLNHTPQTFAMDFFNYPKFLTLKLNFRQIISYQVFRDACMWFCFNQQFTIVIIFMNYQRDLKRPKLNLIRFIKRKYSCNYQMNHGPHMFIFFGGFSNRDARSLISHKSLTRENLVHHIRCIIHCVKLHENAPNLVRAICCT